MKSCDYKIKSINNKYKKILYFQKIKLILIIVRKK